MNETVKRTLRRVPGLRAASQWGLHQRRAYGRWQERRLETVQRRVEGYLATATQPRLQVGAGPYLLQGWLNTDFEPSSSKVVFMDATKPFPLPDAAFTHIFTEHMIEHVSYQDGVAMLCECYRVLRPGGRIRVATPDLMQLVNMYRAEKTTAQVRYLNFAVSDYFPAPKLYNECFLLNSFLHEWGHRFVYDLPTLVETLQRAKFTDVVRCEIGISADPELCGREMHARDHGEEWNGFETMVVEGRKA